MPTADAANHFVRLKADKTAIARATGHPVLIGKLIATAIKAMARTVLNITVAADGSTDRNASTMKSSAGSRVCAVHHNLQECSWPTYRGLLNLT